MPDTLDTLEHKAATHRAHLGDAVAALSRAFDPEQISHDMRETTGALSRNLTHSAITLARRNPVGTTLLVLGAAVMALKTPARDVGTTGTAGPSENYDDRVAAADARMAAKERIRQSGGIPEGLSSKTLRTWLDAGLDALGPDARNRVIDARLKAIDAQEALERQAAKAARTAREAHQSQPLVTTLAVAGVGALIGALLPSTRAEADLLGAKRDQLLRHAESVLHAELEALQDRGETALKSGVAAAKNDLRTSIGS